MVILKNHSILDWDKLKTDDLIGKVTVPIKTLEFGVNDLWLEVSKKFKKTPLLHVKIELFPHIRIKICEARDLVALDMNGKSDPFIEINFQDQHATTKVIKKNLNPVWDETFDFEVKETVRIYFSNQVWNDSF
jgi:hypothetical protein